jgi:hypothetical protein
MCLVLKLIQSTSFRPVMYLEKTFFTIEICLQTKAGEFRLVAFSEDPKSLKIDLKQTKQLGVVA